MAQQTVIVVDTSADTDALAGSDLEFVPEEGTLEIFMASTVNTATVTATVGPENIVRGQAIPLRANGVPNSEEDPPIVVGEFEGGEKIVINIGGTTGSVFTMAVFTPDE